MNTSPLAVPSFRFAKDIPYENLDDPTKGAFFNFLDNPQSAARNTVRAMGGNPRVNPYAARLANKASQEAVIAQLEQMLGGSMPDPDAVRGSVASGFGSGLMPRSHQRGQDILKKIADLSRIEDEDSAGLSVPQSILRSMFTGGVGGAGGDSRQRQSSANLIQLLMGMGLPSAFGSFLDDTFQERMAAFGDYFAPENPDKGFFDFLGL